MTREDVKNTLAYMMFIFPEFKVPNEKIINYTLDIWERALKDRTEEEVKEAIYQHYISSRWTPHLSDLMSLLKKKDKLGLPSAGEMTILAFDALRGRGHYSGENPYDGLHPLTEEAIRSYGGFEVLSSVGDSTYARNQFKEHCTELLEKHTSKSAKSLPPPKEQIDVALEVEERLRRELEGRNGL